SNFNCTPWCVISNKDVVLFNSLIMKVLVLGGTEFIGRGLIASLLENGADVKMLNRGNTYWQVEYFAVAISATKIIRIQIHSVARLLVYLAIGSFLQLL